MTNKHFVAFAEYIRNLDVPDVDKDLMVDMVVNVARKFNSNFDSAKFRKAAGWNPGGYRKD